MCWKHFSQILVPNDLIASYNFSRFVSWTTMIQISHSHHIPNVLNWIEMWWLWRSLEFSESRLIGFGNSFPVSYWQEWHPVWSSDVIAYLLESWMCYVFRYAILCTLIVMSGYIHSTFFLYRVIPLSPMASFTRETWYLLYCLSVHDFCY